MILPVKGRVSPRSKIQDRGDRLRVRGKDHPAEFDNVSGSSLKVPVI